MTKPSGKVERESIRKSERSMMSPVVCLKCGETYDLTTVEVTARYADCSVFKTPCCGRQAEMEGLRLHAGPPALKLEGRFIPLYDQHGALFGAVMSEESAQVMIATVDAYGRRDPSAGKKTER